VFLLRCVRQVVNLFYAPQQKTTELNDHSPKAITEITMDIEILNAMNEGLYLHVLLLIGIILLSTVFLAFAGFVIYLIGIVWFCFEEKRPPTRRRVKPAPPRLAEQDLLAGGVARAEGEAQQFDRWRSAPRTGINGDCSVV
jgi:hypothetical protein